MSPLISWDIAEEGLYRRIALKKDLSKLDTLAMNKSWRTEAPWRNSLVWEDKTIIVTDTSLNIVYATENIVGMNGYSQNEVIGNTPKMFQGEKTEKEKLNRIRISVKKKLPFETAVINYKKNGDIYLCQIKGYPVFNEEKKLINFIALENSL